MPFTGGGSAPRFPLRESRGFAYDYGVRQASPFGKYLLLERVSVGGMAEVFKAKQFGNEGYERLLAIKRILPSMAQDSDFISMFIDEAKICGQLNHPNICQIYELGRVDDSHFIAMEFVWGKDVLQMQNRFRRMRKTMKPEMAAFIAARMCEGLDHAHKKKDGAGRSLNIIHRDISPQNVLVSYDGDVKVIDFGIAKAASRSSKTQAGVLKGKFGYMSPEQVRGLPLDQRSDIFAIGTILYEMLSADRLFIGDSDFETLEKVRNVDVPLPSKVNPEVPAALEAIIMKALHRDVENRYQWAGDMLADLQTFSLRFDPAFTGKQLGEWMREHFNTELKRESEVLEAQKKIGKEAMTNPSVAAGTGHTGVHAPMGADLPSGGTQMLDDSDLQAVETDDQGERTAIVAEGQIAGMHAAHANGHGSPGSEMPALSTQILMTPEPAPLKAESTMILQDGHPKPAGPTPGSGPIRVAANASTIMEGMQAPVLTPEQIAAARARPGPAAGVIAAMPVVVAAPVVVAQPQRVLPYAPKRANTLWKDIAIGVSVAALLVMAVLGIHALMKGGKSTLVVTVNPPRAADVLIDGIKQGHMEEGMPLTLKALASGPHLILVRAVDGSEFKQQITLPAGDVAVLPAVLKSSSAAVATGTLRLKVTAAGASVFVDGAELADGSWEKPIPLRADTAHDIRITKPLREEVKFTVSLKPGESIEKEVDLLPSYAKIKVTSDPAGAEVNVNGHRAGVTPTEANEVDPSKPARVTIRLKGYGQISKYVAFDKGLEQTVDVKLSPSADDGFGAGAELEPVATKDVKDAKAGATDKKAPPKLLGADDLKPNANESGFLIANTQPWAKVIIDGKDTGKMTPIAPRSKIPLKPGRHTVTFVADGKKFNFEVTIKPGEDLRLMKQLADIE